MTAQLFQEIKETFNQNQESVKLLLNFDRIILDTCIMQIQSLEDRLKTNAQIKLTSIHFLPTNTIKLLKNIRQNDSLRTQYEGMFNQGLVLAVSHFSSALHSIFKKAINQACRSCPDLLTATGEDIKITFDELKSYQFNLTEGLGDLVIKKKDISFQDMQSVHRAFKNFFNIDLGKDNITNNIVLAQAARHSIVHAQGIADEKFMKQIRDAKPRDIKLEIQVDEIIKFSTDDIDLVQKSMTTYIDILIEILNERITKSNDLDLDDIIS